MAMTDAAASRGADPDRASFTVAMQAARDQVVLAAGIIPDGPPDLAGEIGRAVLDRLLPPRRHRLSARKVKSPVSRYHARPADDNRPLASQDITSVTIEVHQGHPGPPPPPGRPGSRLDQLTALLQADPGRSWRARDLIAALGTDAGPAPQGFGSQLCRWAGLGLIRKTGRGAYAAAAPGPSGTPQVAPAPPGRRDQLTALLQASPGRALPQRQIAEQLQIPPPQRRSFYYQMRTWARNGIIHPASPGHYTLDHKHPETSTTPDLTPTPTP